LLVGVVGLFFWLPWGLRHCSGRGGKHCLCKELLLLNTYGISTEIAVPHRYDILINTCLQREYMYLIHTEKPGYFCTEKRGKPELFLYFNTCT
jgi:hypothetical protein